MRNFIANDDISIHAVAGTHVVILGFNVSEAARKKLLGFIVERIDITNDNEHRYLYGGPGFPEDMGFKPDETLEALLQVFSWSDFSVKPNQDYNYVLTPVYGELEKPEYRDSVTVTISTEDESSGIHAIYFNRGAAASNAYATRFDNLPPDEVPNNEAYEWLSRGLEEALLAFIAKANDINCGLRGALYEFNYKPVLNGLGRAAHTYGADVKVIYHNRGDENAEPSKANREAIAATQIEDIVIERNTNSFIAHNKFIVLLRNGQPVEVWTGSTNITEGGIYGQSNVGHVVRDPKIAQTYLDYWEELSKDPEAKDLRKWTDINTPLPDEDSKDPYIKPIFSPRGDSSALEWYGKQIEQADQSVFLTAAFGVSGLADAFKTPNDNALRYILMESKGSGSTYDDIKVVGSNRIALCGSKAQNEFEDLLEEQYGSKGTKGLNSHVFYVHTKYMLVNPLTDDPLIISGSANFSNASTKENDENMVIIRGNTRLADIFLGEYMRQFNYYYYRQFNKKIVDIDGDTTLHGKFIVNDDSWTDSYFVEGSSNMKERLLFAQTNL